MGNEQSQDDGENFGIGIRVVRGPDWDWKEQDGGEGSLGVLRQFEGTQEVVVYWDMGSMGNYQFKMHHDLRIYDMAPCGIAHRRVSCDVCEVSPLVGLRWKCTVCDNYDLCSKCYHSDAHDTSHAFVCILVSWSRGEISGPVLPPREGSRKVTLKGILPGAKVVRGMDWKWDQQDGGEGGVGEVQSLDNWQGANDGVKVMWQQSKKMANYRIGCEGKTDLKLLEPPTETSNIYIDHLPVVDVAIRDCNVNLMLTSQEDTDSSDEEGEDSADNLEEGDGDDVNPSVRFKIGDYVRLIENESAVQQLQRGHGGWSDEMTPLLGKTGKVTFIIHNVVGVNIGSLSKVFNPRALQHVDPPAGQFFPDDFVRLSSDCELVRQLQSSHGGWVDKIEKVLGKVGRVMSVPTNDRIVVDFHTAKYTLNPATVTRCEPPPNEIVSGDIVKVIDDLESVKVLQVGHGGWVEDMLKCLGKQGRSVRMDQDGDVRVHVEEQFFWFNQAALIKIKPAAEAGPLTQQEMQEIQNGAVQTSVTVGIHQLSDIFQLVLRGAAQMPAGEVQPTIPEQQDSQSAPAPAPATNTSANSGQVERQKGPSVVYVNERGGLARTISTEDGSNDEISALYKQIRELEEQMNCKVCLSNRKEIVFQCGHGACEGCNERLDSCHICRKKIVTRIRLFT